MTAAIGPATSEMMSENGSVRPPLSAMDRDASPAASNGMGPPRRRALLGSSELTTQPRLPLRLFVVVGSVGHEQSAERVGHHFLFVVGWKRADDAMDREAVDQGADGDRVRARFTNAH